MPPPLIGGGIKRCFCLTYICLSVAYGPKSRTERPRKTKMGTEVAHVTRDSDTSFKVKRSKVKVTAAFTPQAAAAVVMGIYCYVVVRRGRLGGARRFGAHRGRRGAEAYCGGSRTTCTVCICLLY